MHVEMKYDVVIPVVQEDVKSFLKGIKWLKKYLPIKKIVLIGNSRVNEEIPEEYRDIIKYINEDNIISYDEIRRIIKEVSDNDLKSIKRTGWYLQQFIKMQYANICTDDYYLVWDGDTYPIKEVSLFQNNKPMFDVKTEYHEAYFNTMHRILPELNKSHSFSFISEHMLISCKVMRELIFEIEQSKLVGEVGDPFYQKILRAIDYEDLPGSGFSEFETYGTYCMKKYPNLYVIHQWHSLRDANYYFDSAAFSDSDAKWLSKYYDAVSFEKSTQKDDKIKKLYSNKIIQKIFSFPRVQMLENMIRKMVNKR